jgi:hypothetical protein
VPTAYRTFSYYASNGRVRSSREARTATVTHLLRREQVDARRHLAWIHRGYWVGFCPGLIPNDHLSRSFSEPVGSRGSVSGVHTVHEDEAVRPDAVEVVVDDVRAGDRRLVRSRY